MHGEKMREKAFRRLALAPLGLDTTPKRTGAGVRALTDMANLELLPPDMSIPAQQLPSGRPVFVLGISDLASDDWVL